MFQNSNKRSYLGMQILLWKVHSHQPIWAQISVQHCTCLDITAFRPPKIGGESVLAVNRLITYLHCYSPVTGSMTIRHYVMS